MNVFSHAYLPFVSHLWWQNIWDLTCLEVKQLLYCLLDLEHLEDRDKFLVQLCILSGKLFVLWALVSLLSRWVYAAKEELSFQKEHGIHFIGTPKLFIFIYVCLFVLSLSCLPGFGETVVNKPDELSLLGVYMLTEETRQKIQTAPAISWYIWVANACFCLTKYWKEVF